MLPRALTSDSVSNGRDYSRVLFWTRFSFRALGLGRYGAWRYVLTFTAVALLIGVATALLVHRDHERAESYWQTRLQAAARDRAWVVSVYLQAHLQDAEAWAALPAFRARLTRLRGGSRNAPLGSTHAALDKDLSALNSIYAFPAVFLINSQGTPVAFTGEAEKPGLDAVDQWRGVVRQGTPQILLFDEASPKPLLMFAAPVRLDTKTAGAGARSPAVVGVVAVFADPATDLFPRLKPEPAPTRTEKSVLVRRDGSKAVFLSALPNLPNAASVLIVPAQNVNPFLQGAFEGRETVGSFVDDQGTGLLAAMRPVSEPGWVIEETIDAQEAFEGSSHRARMEVLFSGLLMLGCGASLATYRRRQQGLGRLKEMERHWALQRAARYAADIVDTVPAWLLVLTLDLRVQSANQSFLTYFDIRQDDIRGLPLGDIIRTDGLLRQVDQAVKGQATVEEVLLDVRVRGKEIKLPARVTLADLVRGVEGKPEVLLVVEDLTESERLRLGSEAQAKELHETEVRYRALAENSADFIGTHDLDGKILSVTLAVALRAGFKDPQGMVGSKVTDFLPRDRWAEFDAYLDTLRREGRAQGMMKAVMPGGEEVMVEFKNSILQVGGEPAVVFCVGRDATELVRMRKALKEAGRLREGFVKTARNGIVGLDSEGHFTFVNSRAAQISGYQDEELRGRSFSVLLSPEDVEPVSAFIRVCLAESVQISGRSVTIVRKDGSRRAIRLNLTCSHKGVVMAWKDLSEIRSS